MLRIINLRVHVDSKKTLQELLEKKYPVLKGEIQQIHMVRKAVDARKKPQLFFVYTLFVEVMHEDKVLKKLQRDKDVSAMQMQVPDPIVHGNEKLCYRPIVVGFGPSGMLAALYLAREGYRPIVLERGSDVDTRARDVEAFWKQGTFLPSSNVQFGEGGAGTFSDGKLTTRVTHPRLHEIATYFVQFGAPPEIIYKHKPHVGTDILRGMVKRLRQEVIALGGEVRFQSQVTDILLEDDCICGVVINGEEEILSNHVFLGIGHSARDTYEMLYHKQISMRAKPLAIGVRIEHKQTDIDESQYGMSAEEAALGAAEYALVYQDKETGRSAYTFCMCPGGQVVASASEDGGVVTNGMSLYARDSGIANSAMVVSVTPDDFGNHPLDGVRFQRCWEEKAFLLGGQSFKAPIQTVGDFLQKQKTEHLGKEHVYSYEPGVVPSDLHDCLPDIVTDVMHRALPYFGKRIKGFDAPHICMTGVETRTSSPVRMDRLASYQSVSTKGLYPMGEGAGYAGGIMSAALDGAEAAIAFMTRYAPLAENK